MIDVDYQISSVRRQVGSRTLPAGEAHTVTISQTYDAPIEDIWDACTNPERIPRWFLPVSGDLTLGGRFQLEGHAGGTIERCDPPKSFAATWEFGDTTSWIEVRLAPAADGGTRLELEHIVPAGEHWDQFGPASIGIGWDGAFLGLATHLASGRAMAPAEAAAWAGSPEGKRFMTSASDGWLAADIAAGTDEAAARASAARTLAAYTGAEDAAGS